MCSTDVKGEGLTVVEKETGDAWGLTNSVLWQGQGQKTNVKSPESDPGRGTNGDLPDLSEKPQRPFSLQVFLLSFFYSIVNFFKCKFYYYELFKNIFVIDLFLYCFPYAITYWYI